MERECSRNCARRSPSNPQREQHTDPPPLPFFFPLLSSLPLTARAVPGDGVSSSTSQRAGSVRVSSLRLSVSPSYPLAFQVSRAFELSKLSRTYEASTFHSPLSPFAISPFAMSPFAIWPCRHSPCRHLAIPHHTAFLVLFFSLNLNPRPRRTFAECCSSFGSSSSSFCGFCSHPSELTLFLLPHAPPHPLARRLHPPADFLGLLLIVSAIVLVLVGFSHAESVTWSDAQTISMITIGGCLFVLFGLWECYTHRRPIVPPRLFRTRTTTLLLVSVVLHGMPL